MDSLQVLICEKPVTTLSSAKDFPTWQLQLRIAIISEDPKIWDVLTGNLKAPKCCTLSPASVLEEIKEQLKSNKAMADIFYRLAMKDWMIWYTKGRVRPYNHWQSMNKKALSHINQTIASSVKESIGLTAKSSAFETYSALGTSAWETLKKCKYLPNSTPGPFSNAFVAAWKKALADFTEVARDSSSSEELLPQLSAYFMFLDAVANNPETESWLRVHRFNPYNLDVLGAVYEDSLKGERRRDLRGYWEKSEIMEATGAGRRVGSAELPALCLMQSGCY
ncbi:uncharacterized protein N7483_001579 [Penicillium malachiteum]|uniref:uncharacterized protein n=1 Tax=Penicillium malachiteum TaxID=1324776 RepID=UPI0025487CC9|nr:uncharacterized protein N7483_001579 [Penicillium malachiteum]KAJ5736454.1 hypothetical protein N7483_001579 [Penicillium malachiteum]